MGAVSARFTAYWPSEPISDTAKALTHSMEEYHGCLVSMPQSAVSRCAAAATRSSVAVSDSRTCCGKCSP